VKFAEIPGEFPMLAVIGVPSSFPKTYMTVSPEVGPFAGSIDDIVGIS
jgi:hypothetical protein